MQAHQAKGKTALYIPGEDISDVKAAAKDKDLVQRLESTVIHWTRQIKEVKCVRVCVRVCVGVFVCVSICMYV